ncbi:MAG: zinc ribbon domain-containing protein [Clostridia bacterium]|nr:zinc ribbon domain-containing protein [Clostridia bacterium]
MKNNEGNKDSLIKGVGVVLLGVIVLALFYNVFFAPGPMNYGYSQDMGFNRGMANVHMGAGMQMGTTGFPGNQGVGLDFSLGSLLAGVLLILIKLLSILLVIGLVVGVWVVVKDYLLADGDNPFTSLTKGFRGNKVNCPKCGSSVNSKWDFCPDCGLALSKEDKLEPVNNNS